MILPSTLCESDIMKPSHHEAVYVVRRGSMLIILILHSREDAQQAS